MSTVEAPDRGVRVWFAMFGGIVAWIVHLGFLSAFARYTCTVRSDIWIQHAVTVAAIVVTAVATAVAWSLVRAARGPGGGGWDPDDGAKRARVQFAGVLGVILGAVNLALILLEGSYVIFINPCHG